MKPLLLVIFFEAFFCLPAFCGWRDWFKSQDQKDEEVAYALVNHYRQRTIERYHILAHAQSVEVLKYVWVDSLGNPVKDTTSSQAAILVVQYVIRWEGPVTKGGMTQIVSAYDFKRQNVPVVQEAVISTNGVTNEDAAQTAGGLLGILLGN